MNKVFLPVAKIKTDGLQVRAHLDKDVVREYMEGEREGGVVFPPAVVFKDKAGSFWLADGHHRLASAKANGKEKLACDVREGEYVDALRFALGANAEHGLRRTNEDKANAVKMAYEHRKALGLPDVPAANLIAELVGVNHTFASNQLATVASWKNATARTGADGRTRVLPPPPSRPRPEPVEPEADAPADLAPPPPARRSMEPTTSLPPTERKASGIVLQMDVRGKPVPPALSEIWNRRGEMADMARLISEVRVALRKAQDGNDPLFYEVSFPSVLAHLDQAYFGISACEPWCVCPMCQGIGCKACNDRGLMGRFRFDKVVPRELK